MDTTVTPSVCVSEHASSSRPDLKVLNQFLQLARTDIGSRSDQLAAKPGDVKCDVCTGVKRKAIKSCQRCGASYCQTHIRPHMKLARLRSHQLTYLVDNLEEEMCKKHNKPVKLFCKTDRTRVCHLCPILDHKNHEFAPLKEQYNVRTLQTLAEIQKKIKQTEQQIQEAKESVILKQEEADRQMAEGVQVFTALKLGVNRGQKEFMRSVDERQRNLEKHNREVIKELEQQLSELMESSGGAPPPLISSSSQDLSTSTSQASPTLQSQSSSAGPSHSDSSGF